MNSTIGCLPVFLSADSSKCDTAKITNEKYKHFTNLIAMV